MFEVIIGTIIAVGVVIAIYNMLMQKEATNALKDSKRSTADTFPVDNGPTGAPTSNTTDVTASEPEKLTTKATVWQLSVDKVEDVAKNLETELVAEVKAVETEVVAAVEKVAKKVRKPKATTTNTTSTK